MAREAVQEGWMARSIATTTMLSSAASIQTGYVIPVERLMANALREIHMEPLTTWIGAAFAEKKPQ